MSGAVQMLQRTLMSANTDVGQILSENNMYFIHCYKLSQSVYYICSSSFILIPNLHLYAAAATH